MGLEVDLQASAGRGSSPTTCIVMYCCNERWELLRCEDTS